MSTNAYGCLLPHLTRFTIASLHETQPSTPLTQKAPKVRKTSKKRSTLHKRFAGYKEPLAPRLARPEFQLILLKKLKEQTANIFNLWRRGRDSNPRGSYPPTRFPSVLLRPLGHLSNPRLSEGFRPASIRVNIVIGKWPSILKRRERDSNSREDFSPTGFRNQRFQPLSHPSILIW